MQKTLLSIGHGYSARALATRLIPEGWSVMGTTRSEEGCARIANTDVTPIIWPGTDLSEAITKADALLISAGPGPEGDPFLTSDAADALHGASRLKWVGYLSTTGVYGDHDGGWVDEETPLTPSTKRGRARVEAEAAWQRIAGLPLHIFRLAGIYGPGRGPFSKVRAGTARRVIKPGQVFSRIHVEDIAQVLAASLAQPDPGAIYNVCDDCPAPPEDVIAYAATLLGLPLPPKVDYETAEMSPMARSFYAESKRVSNARIKEELGVQLKYPDYKTGLQALLREQG